MIKPLVGVIRCSPILWMLVFVPVVLLAETLAPEAHIVPLAVLHSHATESVAEKTGDAIGGLLNATLANLTELIIALAALHAGQYILVKASIACMSLSDGAQIGIFAGVSPERQPKATSCS